MSREVHPIYGGAIRANKIGSFVKGGETFHIIRPGYCIQGKRRLTWTQIVHEDVPVFEVKVRADLSVVMDKFDAMWARHIGDDKALLAKALDATKSEHRRKFRDGRTGESPAPSLTRDGRGEGKRYPA